MDDEQNAKAGRIMFVLVWVILFVVLFLVFSYYGKSESVVYKVSASELILSANQSGHYGINGLINDTKVYFLIDTGATTVAIPQQLADKMHLVGRYPVTMMTANGQITGSLTRLKSLVFGEFVLHDVKAVIIPGNDDGEVLLGMNVLSQFSINQQGKQLVLKKQQP